MAIAYYPLIVRRVGSGFTAAFPDLPGCAAAGLTVMEAVRNAGDALTGQLRVSAGFYEDIPSPSLLEDVPSGPEGEEVARILVPVEIG